MQTIFSGVPSYRSSAFDRRRRSLSEFQRPVQYGIVLIARLLQVDCQLHEVDIVDAWRANSQSLSVGFGVTRNYAVCQKQDVRSS